MKDLWIQNKHVFYLWWAIIILNLWFDLFLVNGTYFFLDTSFTPFTQLQNFFSQSFYKHFIDILNFIFWYKLMSKLLLVSVLIFGIYFWKVLSHFLQQKLYGKADNKIIDIIAIIISIYNPFVYERFITQTSIVLGTYLLWIGIIYALLYFKDTLQKNLIISVIGFGISLNIFPHTVIFFAFILIILSLVYYQHIWKIIYIWIWVTILNINWVLWNFVFWSGTFLKDMATFNHDNIIAFTSSVIWNLWVELTHLLGYWFWAEKYHILTPDKIFRFWYIAWAIVFFIVLYWCYELYKKDKKMSLSLWSIGILSYILSLGISSSIFIHFNNLFYNYVPFYIGLREPQKWSWVMIIIYIIFFIIGSSKILEKVQHKWRKVIVAWICIIPILWTPASLFAYFNQIRMSDYPPDIEISKNFLLEQWIWDEKIVNFPWHSYIACSWTRSIVTSNKVKKLYYPIEIIRSDNIEIGNLYTNSTDPVMRDIDNFISSKDINLLIKNDIKYILMYNYCADFQNYEFLFEQSDIFTPIFTSTDVNIYKIETNEK